MRRLGINWHGDLPRATPAYGLDPPLGGRSATPETPETLDLVDRLLDAGKGDGG